MSSFKKWLAREGYQTTTINTTLASLRVIEQTWEEKGHLSLKPFQKSLLKRYSRFLHSVPPNKWSLFDRCVADAVEASRPGGTRGPSTKPPLSPAQWQMLFARLSSSEDIVDKVLLFAACVPTLEPAALLRTPFEALTKHLTTPLRDRLRRLQAKEAAAGRACLGECISATPRGAYVCAHRRLQKLGLELGFELDFHCLARTSAAVRATV